MNDLSLGFKLNKACFFNKIPWCIYSYWKHWDVGYKMVSVLENFHTSRITFFSIDVFFDDVTWFLFCGPNAFGLETHQVV